MQGGIHFELYDERKHIHYNLFNPSYRLSDFVITVWGMFSNKISILENERSVNKDANCLIIPNHNKRLEEIQSHTIHVFLIYWRSPNGWKVLY